MTLNSAELNALNTVRCLTPEVAQLRLNEINAAVVNRVKDTLQAADDVSNTTTRTMMQDLLTDAEREEVSMLRLGLALYDLRGALPIQSHSITVQLQA